MVKDRAKIKAQFSRFWVGLCYVLGKKINGKTVNKKVYKGILRTPKTLIPYKASPLSLPFLLRRELGFSARDSQ